MEAAGLVLAVAGTLDICVKYGTQLRAIYRDIKHLERDAEELRVTIQGVLVKTQIQLQSLKSMWTALDPSLQSHFSEAVARLKLRLLASLDDLKQLKEYGRAGSSTPDKLKALYLKKHVKNMDLGFNRRSPIDGRLIAPRSLHDEACAHEGGDQRVVIIFIDREPRISFGIQVSRYDQLGLDQNRRYQYLHGVLYRRRPTCDPRSDKLLTCNRCKVQASSPRSSKTPPQYETQTQYQFILEVPRGLIAPMTLRNLLQSQPRCSLNHRFQLAKQLARSVMFVHTTGFVHKGIRPESVLVFADAQNPIEYNHSFLIGFERSRHAESPTNYAGDLEWERNLYRHSSGPGEDTANTSWPELDVASALADKDLRRGAFVVKDRLVELAQDRLPSLVGLRYTEVTVILMKIEELLV
ncbi:uncharacterized protein KD926_000913 [Aspergillus affinis]|uniref:uncharacterized protein n=1 Tax=Aspergillus affinis TaxID=1070780 RepID=UPI0022FE8792|nr:uncharacterized protein KD926_000913 [Aspergillus affinis]KAI9037046.1 hypothetical protein KD926_000913 [Aspergillus affinis]